MSERCPCRLEKVPTRGDWIGWLRDQRMVCGLFRPLCMKHTKLCVLSIEVSFKSVQ